MGRAEKSQGLAPPAIRKDIRAKQARHIINKTIPALLTSNARARKGAESSELIVDPQACLNAGDVCGSSELESVEASSAKRKAHGRRKGKTTERAETKSSREKNSINQSLTPISKPLIIRILATDTLTAAHHLLTHPTPLPPNKHPCILNMASPLRPGGGVLSGATSQEEFLCSRTTLLPSLRDSYYRLPELGGIWSPDVLVFRNALPLGDAHGELGARERFWVDVVSAGMLRFPELEGERLSGKDRGVVEGKMRGVLRIAVGKGVRRIVLGAWGCGAYGNPVGDVAGAWRRVLDGGGEGGRRGKKEAWAGLEEVVFAIGNRRMADEFASAFDEGIEVESGPGREDGDEEGEEEDRGVGELRAKMAEMEGQMGKVWNADLKARMGVVLDGLRAQLREREGGTSSTGSGEAEEDGGIEIDEHDGDGREEEEDDSSEDD